MKSQQKCKNGSIYTILKSQENNSLSIDREKKSSDQSKLILSQSKKNLNKQNSIISEQSGISSNQPSVFGNYSIKNAIKEYSMIQENSGKDFLQSEDQEQSDEIQNIHGNEKKILLGSLKDFEIQQINQQINSKKKNARQSVNDLDVQNIKKLQYGFQMKKKTFDSKVINSNFENFMKDDKISSHKSSISQNSSEKQIIQNQVQKNVPNKRQKGIQIVIQDIQKSEQQIEKESQKIKKCIPKQKKQSRVHFAIQKSSSSINISSEIHNKSSNKQKESIKSKSESIQSSKQLQNRSNSQNINNSLQLPYMLDVNQIIALKQLKRIQSCEANQPNKFDETQFESNPSVDLKIAPLNQGKIFQKMPHLQNKNEFARFIFQIGIFVNLFVIIYIELQNLILSDVQISIINVFKFTLLQKKIIGLIFSTIIEIKLRKMNFKNLLNEQNMDQLLFGIIIYLMKPNEQIQIKKYNEIFTSFEQTINSVRYIYIIFYFFLKEVQQNQNQPNIHKISQYNKKPVQRNLFVYIFVFLNEIENIIYDLGIQIFRKILLHSQNIQSQSIQIFSFSIALKLIQSIILILSVYGAEIISKKFQWQQMEIKEEDGLLHLQNNKIQLYEFKPQNQVNEVIFENQEENLDSDISIKESSQDADYIVNKSESLSQSSEHNYVRHSIEFSNFTEFILLIDNKYCVNYEKKLKKSSDNKAVEIEQIKNIGKNGNDKLRKQLSFNKDITTDYLFNNINKVSMLCINHPIQLTSINQRKDSIPMNNVNSKKKNTKTYQIFELIKLSNQFFEGLPNSKFLEKKLYQQHNSPRQKDSKELQQIYLQDLLPSIEMKMNLFRFINFPQLQEKYHDLLEQKIYEPYFISNNTILQYENQQNEQKFSFCDIIQKFNQENKAQSKLYFKVCMNHNDYKKQKYRKLKKNQTLMISSSSKNLFDTQSYQNGEHNEENLQESKSPYYTNQRENYWKNKLMESEQVEYFEFDLKQFNDSINTIKNESGRINEQQDHSLVSKQIFINIVNITNIIKSQQKLSDMLYLDAMEQNYSHEQMTPLNSILANSKIVYRRFLEIKKFQENILKVDQIIQQDNEYEKTKRKNEETLRILKAIQQSGQIMWYYNQNQIQRMKIKKKEFKKKLTIHKNIEEQIERVINPFEPQIASRNIQIYIAKKCDFPFAIKNDWVMYQLILFNIIQNAVKYNQFEGNILVILDCKPIQTEQSILSSKQKQKVIQLKIEDQEQQDNCSATHVFETEIIDTGIGISEERQKMLFIPFMELKMKQNLNKVKDNNIGMGLGCSQQIAISLGGDIQIKQSHRGLTIFQFKLPVVVDTTIKQKRESSQITEINPSNKSADISQQIQLINQPDVIKTFNNNKDLKTYLMQQKLDNGIKKLQIAEIELPPEKKNNLFEANNKTNNTFQAQKINRSNLLKSENSESQSFHLQNNSNLVIQRQLNNQIIQPSPEKRGNLRATSIQNIYQQESEDGDDIKMEIQENKRNNKKRLDSRKSIMEINKKLMLLNDSSLRSIDKCQESEFNDLISDNQECLNSQKNQIMQIEQEIQILENIDNIQEDKISQFLTINHIKPKNGKSKSSKAVAQKLSFNKPRSINQQVDQEISQNKKQQYSIIKPQNQFLDINNKNNILNKNIEIDLQINEKQQVLYSVLMNNHKDKLVKNFIKKAHFVQNTIIFIKYINQYKLKQVIKNQINNENEFIINSEIEQNSSQKENSSDSSIYQVVINEQKQLQQLTLLPQDQTLEQQLQQQLEYKQKGIINQRDNSEVFCLYSSESESDDSSSLRLRKSQNQDDQIIQEGFQYQQDQPESKFKKDKKHNYQKLELILEQSKEEENKDENDPQIQQRKQLNKQQNQKQQNIIKQEISVNSSYSKNIEIENLDVDSFTYQQNKQMSENQMIRPKPIVSRQIQICYQYEDDQEENKDQALNQSEIRFQKQQMNQINNSQLSCGCAPRILVVDDIEFNIIPVKYLIKENFDIDVEDASNGAIALQKFKDGFNKECGCPDRAYKVIFMDLQMPVMGGIEASRKIMNLVKEVQNQQKLRVNTSIFALTAFTNQKSKDECALAGILDVFNKPLNYNTLHRVMWIYFYHKKQSEYLNIYREEFQKSFNDYGL